MKKTWIKLGILVVGLLALLATYKLFFNGGGAKGDGTITLIVIDENGVEKINDELDIKKDMTLLDVLKENYQLTCLGPMNRVDETCTQHFGFDLILLSVDGVTTDFQNTFLAFYINDEFSKVGITQIELNDGDVIKIQVEDVS